MYSASTCVERRKVGRHHHSVSRLMRQLPTRKFCNDVSHAWIMLNLARVLRTVLRILFVDKQNFQTYARCDCRTLDPPCLSDAFAELRNYPVSIPADEKNFSARL